MKHQERIFSGQAFDTDIVVAAAYAHINALNRLYRYLQTEISQFHQTESAFVSG
ncbi:hypothetical protein [Nostoc sp. CHAB 5715]|uniref:hypothetical protein n=1 Tax=Nostoc sp. CHAB 5715 TaxID=2780400 RepID=UPI002795D6E6|nr:hypothetical protein [Nostoc sp. CHAB 5715]